MNTKILQKISYGLFVVTTSFEGKDTGCIINTACQVATEMNAVSISVNKANYTCEMIQKAKRFNISVIDQSATFDLFKHFGFQSGRDTDKFAGYNDCKRTANGCMAVTKGTNAFFSVSVIKEIDLGSHILFVGIPSDGEFFSDLLLWLIEALPALIILAVVVFLVVLLIRRIRRRREAKRAAAVAAAQTPPQT